MHGCYCCRVHDDDDECECACTLSVGGGGRAIGLALCCVHAMQFVDRLTEFNVLGATGSLHRQGTRFAIIRRQVNVTVSKQRNTAHTHTEFDD